MTATAILERVVTTTALTLPDGVTARETMSTTASRDENHALYVTRAEAPRNNDRIGTIVRVIAAPSGDGWLLPDGTGRLYGALVNPEPENGVTYYLKDRFICRYNDEAHIGDRHASYAAISVLMDADGSPWPYPGDSIGSFEDTSTWFAVDLDLPGVSDVGQAEPVIEVVENADAVHGPLRGMGQPEADGTVLKNPEREFGKMYVVFDQVNNPRAATWHDNGDGGKFVFHGYFTTYGRNVEMNHMQRFTDMTNPSWAKLKMRRRSAQNHDEATLLSFQRQLREVNEAWEATNEALNEMATDRGHCSDYDDIVTRVGMSPRSRRFDIEVEVEVEFTDDSPSGRLDERLASDYNLSSFDATEITVTGKVRVTFYEMEGRDADAAGEGIDTSEIEDKLDGDLPSGFTVNDWTIINSSYSS